MHTAKVGMKELDRRLGQILAIAQHEPVLVLKRNDPWLCIVPDVIWEHPNPWASMIPPEHPLARLRDYVDGRMDAALLSRVGLRIETGVPVDVVLRVLVLRAVYGIHSESYLHEQLTYDMLCRWFAGLPPESDRVAEAVSAARQVQASFEPAELTGFLLDGAPLAVFATLLRQQGAGSRCN